MAFNADGEYNLHCWASQTKEASLIFLNHDPNNTLALLRVVHFSDYLLASTPDAPRPEPDGTYRNSPEPLYSIFQPKSQTTHQPPTHNYCINKHRHHLLVKSDSKQFLRNPISRLGPHKAPSLAVPLHAQPIQYILMTSSHIIEYYTPTPIPEWICRSRQ